MAVIKSGASTDQLTIDTTSKAARMTPYDTLGVNRGIKRTYRAATAVAFTAALTADQPFFVMQGSATNTIRVQRIVISGFVGTLGIIKANVRKYSTAVSGGTPVGLTAVPLDSASAASTNSLLNVYTAVPTTGTLVGNLASRAAMVKSGTVVDGAAWMEMVFDFRSVGETEPPVLRGTAQGIGLAWSTAAAAAVLLNLEVEWTEE